MDIGQQKGEVPLKKELISYGMELGISVSHELLKIGIPHQIAVPTEDNLLYFNMANSTDYIHMLDSCMKLTLPKQSNTALTFFLSEKRPTYTKIIYLTISDYDQSMMNMLYNTDVTILCVGDKEKQNMIEQGEKLHIDELSETSLENEQLTIAL